MKKKKSCVYLCFFTNEMVMAKVRLGSFKIFGMEFIKVEKKQKLTRCHINLLKALFF